MRDLGENVQYEVKGDTLTIKIDLSHRGPVSAKGSVRVASTLGNHPLVGAENVKLGLNMYEPKK